MNLTQIWNLTTFGTLPHLEPGPNLEPENIWNLTTFGTWPDLEPDHIWNMTTLGTWPHLEPNHIWNLTTFRTWIYLEPDNIWNLTIILLTFYMKAFYLETTAFMTLKLYRLMESPRGHLSTVVTCLVDDIIYFLCNPTYVFVIFR